MTVHVTKLLVLQNVPAVSQVGGAQIVHNSVVIITAMETLSLVTKTQEWQNAFMDANLDHGA